MSEDEIEVEGWLTLSCRLKLLRFECEKKTGRMLEQKDGSSG